MTIDANTDSVTLRSGGEMPIVGFGTWQLRAGRAREAVRNALLVGYRHIDTATLYKNESEVGLALIDSGLPREELFITTKLPPDEQHARGAIEASLTFLRVDYVDLWLIHWPPPQAASRSLYKEMLALRDEGLARAIGVSNYTTDEIDDLTTAAGEAPEVDQVRWSPFLHDPARQRELDSRRIVLEGYSPLKESKLDDPVIGEIAAAIGVTPAQVVLRWHVQHGIVAIPKSARRERIAENFDIFGFSLDDPSMQRLDAISSR
ncbi:MAG: aldo/keto reductase [Acidimicrobiales bacterium]|jgi:diketogulonate reductase-like aldo/keto reductase